jgi:2-epi-5-epi-valiolone synthase
LEATWFSLSLTGQAGAAVVDDGAREDVMTVELHRRRLATTLNRSYEVVLSESLLGGDRACSLPAALGPRSALLVTTPTVMTLYGARAAATLQQAGLSLDTLVLPCSERSKTPMQVMRVCRAALRHRLDRSAVLIALGGGVCMDIVTVAASSIRRGIGCIRIPTTLIGQIDAALGAKGAVNYLGHKSYIGCFYPPEMTLLDPTTLRSLPKRHLRSGLAEMIKIALVRDAHLFRLVEAHAPRLIASGFQAPRTASRDALWRAATAMLAELEPNLYENVTHKRFVDMGHIFSPLIESASRFEITHGEAVAVDLALSASLAGVRGWLSDRACARIVRALAGSGLPVSSPFLTRRLCLEALAEADHHRRHLVLPTGIGQVAFVEDDGCASPAVLDAALDRLETLASDLEAPGVAHAIGAHA